MRNERLAIEAQKTKAKESMERLYTSNLGLMYSMAKDLQVPQNHFQDYLQLCYEATVDAVHAYDSSKTYPYIAYLRRCVKYRYYCYALEMMAPLRLTRTAVSKSLDTKYVSVSLDAIPEICVDYSEESLDRWFLRMQVWQIVHDVLNKEQEHIIIRRYAQHAKYSEIAREMNMPPRNVRYRESRSLAILRENADMRSLAHDYFGLC